MVKVKKNVDVQDVVLKVINNFIFTKSCLISDNKGQFYVLGQFTGVATRWFHPYKHSIQMFGIKTVFLLYALKVDGKLNL